MKSLFDQEVFNEISTRLAALTENSQAKWGKMTPGQMLAHCQAPLNIMLEKEDYGLKPNWLINVLFKKSLYNDSPMRKNLPTAKGLKQREPKDFNQEKTKIEVLLNEVNAQRDRQEWAPHPAFGKFTASQYGKIQYKHLDHHLKQFGV